MSDQTDRPAPEPTPEGTPEPEQHAAAAAPTRRERAGALLSQVRTARAGLAVAVAAVVLGSAGVGFAVGHATAGGHDRHHEVGVHQDGRGPAGGDPGQRGPGGMPLVPVQPPQPALPPEQSEGETPSDRSSDQSSSLSLG